MQERPGLRRRIAGLAARGKRPEAPEAAFNAVEASFGMDFNGDGVFSVNLFEPGFIDFIRPTLEDNGTSLKSNHSSCVLANQT